MEICDKIAVAHGLCAGHLYRLNVNGDIDPLRPLRRMNEERRPCLVPWCHRMVKGGGLCWSHRDPQRQAYGGEKEAWAAWALAYLPPSDCWLWPFAKNHDGYGVGPGHERAHRFMLRLAGRPVPDGLETLHQCDVRACVNPQHLRHGTHADNMRERAERNPDSYQQIPRQGPRKLRSDAKLSVEKVVDIKRRLRDGDPVVQIAIAHGVSKFTIYGIKSGRSWAHVTEDTGLALNSSTV